MTTIDFGTRTTYAVAQEHLDSGVKRVRAHESGFTHTQGLGRLVEDYNREEAINAHDEQREVRIRYFVVKETTTCEEVEV